VSAGTGLRGALVGRVTFTANLNAGYCEHPGQLPETRFLPTSRDAAVKTGVSGEVRRCARGDVN